MSSSAPSPWAFIRSRARSSRYFLSRSQLMRSCQSTPTMPKFAMSLLGGGVAPLPNLPPRIAPAKPARTRLYHTCRHSGLSTGPTISQNFGRRGPRRPPPKPPPGSRAPAKPALERRSFLRHRPDDLPELAAQHPAEHRGEEHQRGQRQQHGADRALDEHGEGAARKDQRPPERAFELGAEDHGQHQRRRLAAGP